MCNSHPGKGCGRAMCRSAGNSESAPKGRSQPQHRRDGKARRAYPIGADAETFTPSSQCFRVATWRVGKESFRERLSRQVVRSAPKAQTGRDVRRDDGTETSDVICEDKLLSRGEGGLGGGASESQPEGAKVKSSREETEAWVASQRVSYRRCRCGQRVPSSEALRLHQLRGCLGEFDDRILRLGEAMAAAPGGEGFGAERLLEIIKGRKV